RLTLVSRVSALNCSFKPRMGSRGASSTEANREDMIWEGRLETENKEWKREAGPVFVATRNGVIIRGFPNGCPVAARDLGEPANGFAAMPDAVAWTPRGPLTGTVHD